MTMTKVDFDTRYPAAATSGVALLEALEDMIDLSARCGEEVFQFVCGGVWAIEHMGCKFGLTSPGSPGLTAAIAVARRLYRDQGLDEIEPTTQLDA